MSHSRWGTRSFVLASVVAVVGAPGSGSRTSAVEQIAINGNRVAAGRLDGNVLTVRLEAREGEWHPDGDKARGITVRAFGESGKPLSIPGPLLRVIEGTEIHAFVKNAIGDKPLIVHGLSTRGAPIRRACKSRQARRATFDSSPDRPARTTSGDRPPARKSATGMDPTPS
jgi:hypothetical protein